MPGEVPKIEDSVLIEEGRKYSKNIEGWSKFVAGYNKSGYESKVIEMALKTMKVLSEGKSLEEARSEMRGSLFAEGSAAWMVSCFHPRGEEFREYWNGPYRSGLPEEKIAKLDRERGVVNPAIYKH